MITVALMHEQSVSWSCSPSLWQTIHLCRGHDHRHFGVQYACDDPIIGVGLLNDSVGGDDVLIPTPSYVTPVALMIGPPSWYSPTVTRSFMTNDEWYDAVVMSKR